MEKKELLQIAKRFGLDIEAQYLLDKGETVEAVLRELDLNEGPSHNGTLITKPNKV